MSYSFDDPPANPPPSPEWHRRKRGAYTRALWTGWEPVQLEFKLRKFTRRSPGVWLSRRKG